MRNSQRFTTPGEALGALKETMRTEPKPERFYKCRLCNDTGWEEVSAVGRTEVRLCSQGCGTPTPREQRASSSRRGGKTIR